MKKILLSGILSIAAASSTSAHVKNNFYAGIGLADLVGNHSASTSYFDTPNTFYNHFGVEKNALGIGIMVGYMANFNSFLLGLELDYIFGNINKTHDVQSDSTGNKITVQANATAGAWGAALKLGYSCFERMMPYIRLGIENRQFKVSHTLVNVAIPIGLINDINASSRKTAFTPGVGVDFKLNKYLALGLDYRCAFYSSFTKNGVLVNTPPAITSNVRVKPRVSTAMLSLKYIWG